MKIIISQNESGGVSITRPAPDFTAEQVLKSVNLGKFARIIDETELPVSEEYYKALEIDAKTITLNFDKAKELTKDRLRQERIPLLDEQDILFMRAQESNSDITEIVAEKNRLRDITKSVDLAKNIQDLDSITCK